LTAAEADLMQSRRARPDRARLSLVLLACWLLHDEWFRHARLAGAGLADAGLAQPARLRLLLTTGLADLAAVAAAPQFVADPDRREELVRLCLSALGLRPAGETIAQAEDRLATLNSAERERLVLATRAAEARARAIREAMARRAREAEVEANLKAMRE
jgi:hypothetical protein